MKQIINSQRKDMLSEMGKPNAQAKEVYRGRQSRRGSERYFDILLQPATSYNREKIYNCNIWKVLRFLYCGHLSESSVASFIYIYLYMYRVLPLLVSQILP